MTQQNDVSVKFSKSQLNESKSTINNGIKVTVNLPSNMFYGSNNETSFPHNSLITDDKLQTFVKVLQFIS